LLFPMGIVLEAPLIGFLVIGLIFFTYLKWRQHLRDGEKMNYSMYAPLFSMVGIGMGAMVLINIISPSPLHKSARDKERSYMENRKMYKQHPDSAAIIYAMVKSCFDERPLPGERVYYEGNEKKVTSGEMIFMNRCDSMEAGFKDSFGEIKRMH